MFNGLLHGKELQVELFINHHQVHIAGIFSLGLSNGKGAQLLRVVRFNLTVQDAGFGIIVGRSNGAGVSIGLNNCVGFDVSPTLLLHELHLRRDQCTQHQQNERKEQQQRRGKEVMHQRAESSTTEERYQHDTICPVSAKGEPEE